MRIVRYTAWVAVAGWMALIFLFSSLPGSDVPGGIAPYAHFVVYAVLGALILVALGRPGLVRHAVVAASAYGITDEIHQMFVPGRTADPLDWLIDSIGALAGALLVLSMMRRRASR